MQNEASSSRYLFHLNCGYHGHRVQTRLESRHPRQVQRLIKCGDAHVESLTCA